MTFRLEGLHDLERALEQVARQSTRTAITRRALQKAAEPMAELARQYAPYDEGELEASIKISSRVVGEVGRAAYSATMRETGGDKGLAIAAMRAARRSFKALNPAVNLYMGPTRNAFHAYWIEFGTAPHVNGGKFAGSRHPGTAPEPFMRPAFDAEARPTIDRLAPLIWTEIEKHAARVAKRRG